MSSFEQEMKGYRIKSVAQITGLTTHVIRKWEQRYNLLTPQRSENGYRVYSDQDLQLLMYLKSQLDSGKIIGQLAAQGTKALKEAIASDALDVSEISEGSRERALTVIQAARRMDQLQAERFLLESLRELGLDDSCEKFFFPLLRTVGDLWHQGKLTISSEHLISQTIRRLLAETALSQKGTSIGPTAIVGCMPNDFHDIGAMTAAGILQRNGWRTFYVGPNGDIELIHFACVKRHSKLVILACMVEQSPKDMKKIIFDITKHLLPISTVIVGGVGANVYRDWFEKKDIHIVGQLQDLKKMTPKSFRFHDQLLQTSN